VLCSERLAAGMRGPEGVALRSRACGGKPSGSFPRVGESVVTLGAVDSGESDAEIPTLTVGSPDCWRGLSFGVK